MVTDAFEEAVAPGFLHNSKENVSHRNIQNHLL